MKNCQNRLSSAESCFSNKKATNLNQLQKVIAKTVKLQQLLEQSKKAQNVMQRKLKESEQESTNLRIALAQSNKRLQQLSKRTAQNTKKVKQQANLKQRVTALEQQLLSKNAQLQQLKQKYAKAMKVNLFQREDRYKSAHHTQTTKIMPPSSPRGGSAFQQLSSRIECLQKQNRQLQQYFLQNQAAEKLLCQVKTALLTGISFRGLIPLAKLGKKKELIQAIELGQSRLGKVKQLVGVRSEDQRNEKHF